MLNILSLDIPRVWFLNHRRDHNDIRYKIIHETSDD